MFGCVVARGVLAVVLAGAVSAPALAQDDDDWEFAQDPARQLSVASVRYDGGKAVVAQCERGELKVVIVGLPAATQATRHLDASRADGRRDHQGWFAPTGQTAFTSTVSGRDARFLRGGGLFELRSSEGEAGTPMRASFDLPTQSANLDRVLTACGYAVSDERDLLERATGDLKTEWQAEHENDRPPIRSRSRSVSQPGARARQGPPAPPRAPHPADTSCIVRGGEFADCRLENVLPDRAGVEAWMRRQNGVKLEARAAAANEGRVAYPQATAELLRVVTVIDSVTVPAD